MKLGGAVKKMRCTSANNTFKDKQDELIALGLLSRKDTEPEAVEAVIVPIVAHALVAHADIIVDAVDEHVV
jgi:hypothetical protein